MISFDHLSEEKWDVYSVVSQNAALAPNIGLSAVRQHTAPRTPHY